MVQQLKVKLSTESKERSREKEREKCHRHDVVSKPVLCRFARVKSVDDGRRTGF